MAVVPGVLLDHVDEQRAQVEIVLWWWPGRTERMAS
jgi:hypothetical protein